LEPKDCIFEFGIDFEGILFLHKLVYLPSKFESFQVFLKELIGKEIK